ncbi:MAG: tetratricopeptide repeat protein [Bacteroidetes bacterium]|nr:tetratricopeptide repeat protein [Bacteroidota bacterium]
MEKAAIEYENALKFSVNTADKVKAYSNLGSVKFKLGDYAGAINNCDKAIKLDTNYAFAYTNRGCAKQMLKNYEGAIEDYNRAIKSNPQEANAIKNRNILLSIIENSKK